MSNTTLSRADASDIMERVITSGDLAKLTAQDRVQYYGRVCDSVGLNPLTRPFEYINLNGKLTLYARKDATDQLRKLYGVSLMITARDRLEDVYIVTARATLPDGRTDESTGVVNLGGLKGDNLANALMKAETKAKRRVTLSICGLGWLDETEMQTIADARPVNVNVQTGEIVEPAPPLPAHQQSINANLKRKPDVAAAQARDMFWEQFAPVLGDWNGLERLLGQSVDTPTTVEEWRVLWRATNAAINAEAQLVEA